LPGFNVAEVFRPPLGGDEYEDGSLKASATKAYGKLKLSATFIIHHKKC